MNVDLEIQLIEALDALDQGESLDAILARHPESAATLKPMLLTASALPSFRMVPSEAQKMKSRQAFLQQGAAMRQSARRRPATGFLVRLAVVAGALSITFAVLGVGAVAASGSSLPGDPLYGLKRTVENVRMNLTGSASARASLQAEFDQQRRVETNTLLNSGREAEVRFNGPIESIQPDAWIVGGLAVRIDANTRITGQPQIDRLAEVRGMTGRNGLRAAAITVAQPPATDVTPRPSPSPTEKPSPTSTVTPTSTTNPTETPEPTQPEPTQPRPTRVPPTPTVEPTAEPVGIEFTGSVNSQSATGWTIDGTAVDLDDHTIIDGNIGIGQRVSVQAWRYADGRLLATQIKLIEDGGSNNGNDNSNHNGNGNNNSNDNGDSNRNSNRNANDNNNENSNHNSNDNGDHNSNENGNHNGNENSGGNENSNHNSNDN